MKNKGTQNVLIIKELSQITCNEFYWLIISLLADLFSAIKWEDPYICLSLVRLAFINVFLKIWLIPN